MFCCQAAEETSTELSVWLLFCLPLAVLTRSSNKHWARVDEVCLCVNQVPTPPSLTLHCCVCVLQCMLHMLPACMSHACHMHVTCIAHALHMHCTRMSHAWYMLVTYLDEVLCTFTLDSRGAVTFPNIGHTPPNTTCSSTAVDR